MSGQWTMPSWLVVAVAVVAVLALLALVVLAAVVGRLARRDAAREARGESLHRRVEELERRADAAPGVATSEAAALDEDRAPYVITRLGDLPPVPDVVPAPVLPPGQFADVLLREGVVQSASLIHGLRRALSPEVRHRIRFEMKREVKRARKTRRAEQRAALRDWQARQRATDLDESAA